MNQNSTVTPSRMLLQRYGWLLLAVVCLILGHLLVWQRGLYTDDYSFKRQVVNAVTGERHFYIPDSPNRFLAFTVDVNLAGLVPEYELLVRVLAALAAGANALLLGGLVSRMTRARLAGVVTGWLFLMPFYAYQALFWVAAYLYLFSTFFALLFLHACYAAFTRPQTRGRWRILAVLCFMIAVAFGEQVALSAILVPVMALVLARQGRMTSYGAAIRQAVILLLIPAVFTIGVVVFAYGPASMVSTRGGTNLTVSNIASQASKFIKQLNHLTVWPNSGLRMVNESFRLGAKTILASPAGMALLALAGCLLLLAAAFWQRDENQPHISFCAAVIAICCCFIWLMLTTLLPGILIVRQTLVPRMLYVPLAGASVAGGVLTWLFSGRLRHPMGEKLVVLAAGGMLIFSTLCVLGYARAYAVRSALDQRQLSSLKQALPSQYIPAGAWVFPVEADERLFGRTDGLSQVIFGVFQTSWSARDGLCQTYQRSDIATYVNSGWTIKPVEYKQEQGAPAGEIYIVGTRIPLDKTLMFVYRDGKSTVVESMVVEQDGGTKRTISFPLAEKLSANGLATLKDYPASTKGKTLSER